MAREVVNDLNDSDVLFGRGRAVHINAGNIRFRQLVVMRSQLYKAHADNKAYRRAIAMEVIGIVQSKGGRFLKKRKIGGDDDDAEGTWEVAPMLTTLTKVKQALRDSIECMEKVSRETEKDPNDAAAETSAKHRFPNSAAAPISVIDAAARTRSTPQGDSVQELMRSRIQRLQEEQQIRSALLIQQQVEQTRRLELLAIVRAQEEQQRRAMSLAAANSWMISPQLQQQNPFSPLALAQARARALATATQQSMVAAMSNTAPSLRALQGPTSGGALPPATTRLPNQQGQGIEERSASSEAMDPFNRVSGPGGPKSL